MSLERKDGKVSLTFEVGTEKAEWHDLSMAQGWQVVGYGLLGGFVLGMITHPLALIITIPLGLMVPAVVLVIRGATAPKQSIETMLVCDGTTVTAFNRRQPVKGDGKPKRLFSVPLDEIGAIESGKAMTLFGTDIQHGDYKAVPYQMMGDQRAVSRRESIAQETTALFFRCKRGLHMIFAENMTSALVYNLVGQINDFLAASHELRGPLNRNEPQTLQPIARAPAQGFDL